MRDVGDLATSMGQPSPPPLQLPKVLHQIWLGSDLPEEFARYAEKWQELHPGWEYRLWTEENLPDLIHQDLYDAADTAGNVWQLRSDLARYEILFWFGGVYVDCDFEPLKPLDPLLEGVEAFAAWEAQDVWVNNAILGFTPGHPFLIKVLGRIRESVVANRTRRPNHATGPRFLTRLYREDPDLTVFDQHLFYPYSFSELHRRGETFPDAYAVHHWANARRQAG